MEDRRKLCAAKIDVFVAYVDLKRFFLLQAVAISKR